MTNRNRISSLVNTVSKTNKITHIGYNMRFTNRVDFIKKKIFAHKISNIKSVHINVFTDFDRMTLFLKMAVHFMMERICSTKAHYYINND